MQPEIRNKKAKMVDIKLAKELTLKRLSILALTFLTFLPIVAQDGGKSNELRLRHEPEHDPG
jgi:hypothetical protein